MPRIGLDGDDETSGLEGVSSSQAASDVPAESFQAASVLFGETSPKPELLSEPSAYLGLLLRVLLLRRTFVGAGPEAFAFAEGLELFLVGVGLG